MPRGDGTGPIGIGAMSGHGAGYCAGYEKPGYAGNASGRGFGRGSGRGRGGGHFGWRNMFHASGMPRWMRFGWNSPVEVPLNKGEERQMLQEQAEELQSELDSIKERLSKIENQSTTEK